MLLVSVAIVSGLGTVSCASWCQRLPMLPPPPVPVWGMHLCALSFAQAGPSSLTLAPRPSPALVSVSSELGAPKAAALSSSPLLCVLGAVVSSVDLTQSVFQQPLLPAFPGGAVVKNLPAMQGTQV